jgi:hypothetical protein
MHALLGHVHAPIRAICFHKLTIYDAFEKGKHIWLCRDQHKVNLGAGNCFDLGAQTPDQ